jgi:preprotein translocase subunit SecG
MILTSRRGAKNSLIAGASWKAAKDVDSVLFRNGGAYSGVRCIDFRDSVAAGTFRGQGSQTAFGPRAAANVLTRFTTWSAIIFMCTSITLVVLFVRSTGSHSVLEGTPAAPVSAPAKPGK